MAQARRVASARICDTLRMHGSLRFALLLFACGVVVSPPALAGGLEVETHRSSEISAHSNAHLILGARDALLVDATMTLPDAAEVAKRVERSGRTLRTVFITNSQPDKYLGLALLAERFPEARIVSTPEVVAEIAERGPKYLERLRARWGDRIATRLVVPEALAGDTLALEEHVFRVHRFTGGECPNAAALHLPATGDFFSGALVFEGSHLFLRERDIPGWREHLEWIRDHGGIRRIHPAHGATTDLGVLDAMHRYLDDFEEAVGTGDREVAIAAMVARYPDHALERLLREYSVPAYLPEKD